LDELGRPERGIAGGVHVVGSKGKGSVAALLAGALGGAGPAPCGLFSSPHVFTVRERLALAGGRGGAAAPRPLSSAALEKLVTASRPAIERAVARGPLSRFEALTGLALQYFVEAGCTRAVLEAGVGGALDATNVLGPRAALVVCGLIDFEHTALLGDSLEDIVRAKLGVASPGTPIVLGRQQHPEVYEIARAVAAERASELTLAEEAVKLEAEGVAGDKTRYGLESVSLEVCPGGTEGWAASRDGGAWGGRADMGLRGAHQAENAQLAAAALLRLARAGWSEGQDFPALARALAGWQLPGRFQIAPCDDSGHVTVMDGAHTPLAAAALAREVLRVFPDCPVAVVLAMARDKDAEAFTEALVGGLGRALAHVACTEAPIGGDWTRSLPAGDLAAAATAALARRGLSSALAAPASPLAQAAARACAALPASAPGGVLLVTGSLYAVRAFASAPAA